MSDLRFPSRYPWLLIGLLWLVAFLNAADRNILLAVLPTLKSEFGLTETELALLGSLFFWVYAVGAFLAGRVADSVRRSRVILYGLIFWSIATGASSLATGFAMLLALRGLVAIGESAYYPTATALIGDWHPPATRSRALSIHQTAVFAGAGLGAVATGFIADKLSWHAPFLLFGAIGLVHAVLLSRTLRDAPIRHTAAEAGKPAEPIGIVLGIPPALMLCVVFALVQAAAVGDRDRSAASWGVRLATAHHPRSTLRRGAGAVCAPGCGRTGATPGDAAILMRIAIPGPAASPQSTRSPRQRWATSWSASSAEPSLMLRPSLRSTGVQHSPISTRWSTRSPPSC